MPSMEKPGSDTWAWVSYWVMKLPWENQMPESPERIRPSVLFWEPSEDAVMKSRDSRPSSYHLCIMVR